MRRRYFLKRRLNKISVPTLVSWGELGNPLFPLTVGQEVAAMIPGAELVVVPGGTHFTMQGKPDEFVQAIRPFLLSDERDSGEDRSHSRGDSKKSRKPGGDQ